MNTPSTKSYACYRFILSRATKRCSCFESGRGGGARFSGTMAKRVREGEGGEIYADSLVMSVCNLHATHGPLMAWLSRVKLSLDASKTREKSFFFFFFYQVSYFNPFSPSSSAIRHQTLKSFVDKSVNTKLWGFIHV